MKPTVSFIIPSYNDEKTITKCLDSLLNLDYPKDCLDIIVVDQGSKDRTTAIVKQYSSVTLHNYVCNKPKARNIALGLSKGEYIFNFCGNVIAKRNLLACLLPKFNEDVHIVGVPNQTPNKDEKGKAIGGAIAGFFAGIGTNTFLQNTTTDNDVFVEHVPFCCYKRNVFDAVGNFNKTFDFGDEAEFNIRCRKKGYKILFTSDTHVELYKPTSYKKLFCTMYNYGMARSEIIRIHPDTFSFYDIGPLLFIPTLIMWFLLVIIQSIPNIIFSMLIFIYLFVCLMSYPSVKGFIIYPILHFGYGYGLLRGVLKI